MCENPFLRLGTHTCLHTCMLVEILMDGKKKLNFDDTFITICSKERFLEPWWSEMGIYFCSFVTREGTYRGLPFETQPLFSWLSLWHFCESLVGFALSVSGGASSLQRLCSLSSEGALVILVAVSFVCSLVSLACLFIHSKNREQGERENPLGCDGRQCERRVTNPLASLFSTLNFLLNSTLQSLRYSI